MLIFGGENNHGQQQKGLEKKRGNFENEMASKWPSSKKKKATPKSKRRQCNL
jgi:hypothetical protein